MRFRRDFLNIAAIGITAGVLMMVIFGPTTTSEAAQGPEFTGIANWINSPI
ncbi:MAG: hypothetical protein VX608_04065 [Chloroflexota bacterium]|nr:hypothetical protein [Chloroflexota bacterium]